MLFSPRTLEIEVPWPLLLHKGWCGIKESMADQSQDSGGLVKYMPDMLSPVKVTLEVQVKIFENWMAGPSIE